MPPLTITLDTLHTGKAVFTKNELTGNVEVEAEYTLTTAQGQYPVPRVRPIPLNATRQNQLNAMWNDLVSYIRAQEGLA